MSQDQSETPVILSVDELKTLQKSSDFNEKYRLLEIHIGEATKEKYEEGHIQNAIFLDMMKCTEPSRYYPRNVQNKDCFSAYAGSLGISNRHHLIIYDRSPFGFFPASRMWWIFRLFGHTKVTVLNGGLNAWLKVDKLLSNEIPSFNKEEFKINYNEDLIRNYEQINDIIANKSNEITILDARGPDEYNKVNETDQSPCHIPTAKNVPYDLLFNKETGLIKDPESIKELFLLNEVDLSKPMVASCLTGVTGSSLVLALALLGNNQTPLYYGSWTEYSEKKKDEAAKN